MRLTLTPSQLDELTGLVMPSAQIRWLKKNGWVHSINRQGHPVVDRRYYDMRMGMSESVITSVEPNFEALYA